MQFSKLTHKTIVTLLFNFIVSVLAGQELNCTVTINSEQVQTSDRSIFEDMEQNITQFMNSRKWTGDDFKNYERIKCGIFLTIKMPSIGSYTAKAQVTSSRPIYNSTYETVVLNFADQEWTFDYLESQTLEFNDNNYISNLTSILAYYAYVIIGMDYDSFSERGGDLYFQKAFAVVNNAQQSNKPGWKTTGNQRNRYSLVANLINPQMMEVRKSNYKYHRYALDNYISDPDVSRQIILEVLKNVKSAYLNNPTSIVIIAFFDAKSNELVNIFSEGSLGIRKEVFEILQITDPKRSNYQAIME